MEYILSFAWIGIEIAAYFLFFAAFLPKKHKRAPMIILYLCTWLLTYCNTYLEFQGLPPQLLSAFIIIGATFVAYGGFWLTHILLYVIVLLFNALIETLFAYGTSSLMGISFAEFVWLKLTYTTVISLGKIVVLFCCWLLYRVKDTSRLGALNKKWIGLTILFPTVSLAILALNFYNNQTKEDISFGIILMAIILVAANAGIIYLINTLAESVFKEQELKLAKQQMTIQAKNIFALEENYRVQRKTTHEFERHLQTLKNLLLKNEIDTATNYLMQLQNSKELRLICVNSNHPIIDVILNEKLQKADERNIKMQLQVNDLACVRIQPDMLVVLLSNLLDNAIEACEKLSGNREIFCSILYDDGLRLSVRNSSKPVEIVNGIIPTSKDYTADHGYGIPAIRYILDQLNSEYVFDYSDGWFRFVAEISF